jgi:anti-sigma regulatory factor (Ser/Thr protein kinase)
VTEAPEVFELEPDARAAARARQLAREILGDRVDEEFLDGVCLVVSELVTNAVLHAGRRLTLSVGLDERDKGVRIEVGDPSPAPVVPRSYSEDSGTGRGLILVEALSDRWGVDAISGGAGKTVWAEMNPQLPAPKAHQDRPDPRGSAPQPSPGLTEPGGPDPVGRRHDLVTVRLLGLPVAIYTRAAEHSDELQREFALILERHPGEGSQAPGRLLSLIEELNGQFGTFATSARGELERAVRRQSPRVDLAYDVPPEMGPAVSRLAALFEEADRYCRRGELLTLATPPEGRLFRDWFLSQFTDQLAGRRPLAWDEWLGSRQAERAQQA